MSQSINYLITSGCSFSQVINADVTWPVPLSKSLNATLDTNGRGAVGNGLISKSIIHRVSETLNIKSSEEILVGIMWSSFDRFEIYNEKPNLESNNLGSWYRYYCNPQWIADENKRNYIVINPHWKDDFTTAYLKNFYDARGMMIITLEHILRVQWFLKLCNIKYFMTCMGDDLDVIEKNSEHCSDIKYLYDLISWDEWLPVKDMNMWSINSGLPYRDINDGHPSTIMHESFVNTVILPHLKTKGYIK